MSAPKIVLDLVSRFADNRDAYRRDYGETETRRELLDPLFKALGWDIDNASGHAEAYKDVVHEDSVKIGVTTKAPDYSFRVGGVRKFFLEAKKPAVNIKDDIDAAYQLRRYAWSAKLPLSVLSNFGEFAVYDCRVRPAQTDKPAVGRLMYFTSAEYEKRWDEIAAVFSKEAVYKGSFDKYAAGKTRRGTAEVDDAFLEEIESWRDALARNIALRNEGLGPADLNFAVQQTIDRIIFLRICEDRGIETYGRLRQLQNGEHTYARMKQLFQDADDRYNSGLFHFRNEKGRGNPDSLTLSLSIDDKPLKDILRHIYYPESPYEFSVLPADILGQVYEQFLGKVIRLTSAGQAKVEDKPEVKKAGGVYYTPTYIVEYIVKQTVGNRLASLTPEKAAKLRMLDPACGSGSFLIGAYQYLLDWHRNWYAANEPEAYAKGKAPRVYRGPGGAWRLTTAERKRILLNNIFGVDIDPQAVEVTKLSLLLKVLEDESAETIGRNREMFHERALPDLDQNVKCGNSLIGTDFFAGRLALADEERTRVNPFDWTSEFPSIVGKKNGGFDVVIGNPPYVRQESLASMKDYLAQHYECYESSADLFAYFMERAAKLLRKGGMFSYIVSSSVLRATYATALRQMLKRDLAVVAIVDFGGLAVFENAKDTYVCIPVFAKTEQPVTVTIARVPSLALDVEEYVKASSFKVPATRLEAAAWALRSDSEEHVFAKIKQGSQRLGDYISEKMFRGLLTGLNEAFEISDQQREAIVSKEIKDAGLIKPFLGGQNIRRYQIEDKARYVIAIPSGWTRSEYAKKKGGAAPGEREGWAFVSSRHPGIAEHLAQFESPGRKRQDQGEFWWELRSCDYYSYFDAPKIIFPDICKGPRFYLDADGYYLANTAYCLGIDDLFLLGLLNSKLFWFAISQISIPFGVRAGQFRYRLIYQYMEQVPIRGADPEKLRPEIEARARELLQLHASFDTAKTPQARTGVERQITAASDAVDQLVFRLYGLSDSEIRTIEASVGGINGNED